MQRLAVSPLMLDELEKAHRDVLNILLQILEDGMLTDGKGRTVNFKNTILIMTSNVGSKRVMELSRLEAAAASLNQSGNSEQDENDAIYSRLSAVVKEEPESEMRPEFLNIIDEIVAFSPLAGDDLTGIAGLILDKTVELAADFLSYEYNLNFQYTVLLLVLKKRLIHTPAHNQ
jgi:ATP-dependent Clp protease ATP-binding subunit ClpA